ncbi:hypothetical protein MRX96_017736 [Rhipicephalus microplus]
MRSRSKECVAASDRERYRPGSMQQRPQPANHSEHLLNSSFPSAANDVVSCWSARAFRKETHLLPRLENRFRARRGFESSPFRRFAQASPFVPQHTRQRWYSGQPFSGLCCPPSSVP